MISAFSIFFLFAIVSIALHRKRFLKPFALLSFVIAFGLSYMGYDVLLNGFSSQNRLFEMVLEVVLFALVLHEDEDITITQILFLASASILLLQSNQLLTFIISFEALSIISIVVATFVKTKEEVEGVMKMFLSASLATGILFLGMMFYLLGGGLLLSNIPTTLNSFEVFGLFIVMLGLFYKMTIVPFHNWAVDSYALMKPSHTALISGVAKTVVVVATFKIFSPFLQNNLDFSVVYLSSLAIITITLGNFLALFSKKIAQILSYSSIAHAGYILLAFVSVDSEYAKDGVLYMAIAYIFMQSGAFLVVDILKQNYKIENLDDIKGFAHYNKTLSLFFTIQLFSLAGIPLLAGFLAKVVVFYSLVDIGLWYVALIALLNSALSVGYYAWIVKGIYFEKSSVEISVFNMKNKLVAQSILVVGTLLFGVFASIVF